jgi:flagellar hook-basal body complex protein FliE
MAAPISNITPLTLPQISTGSLPAGKPGEFQGVLNGAIQQIEGLNQNANDSVQKFLSGQNEELHTTILATQKAELAFQLGLQISNKVVDAYQEIMKMQM